MQVVALLAEAVEIAEVRAQVASLEVEVLVAHRTDLEDTLEVVLHIHLLCHSLSRQHNQRGCTMADCSSLAVSVLVQADCNSSLGQDIGHSRTKFDLEKHSLWKIECIHQVPRASVEMKSFRLRPR